MNVIRKNIIVQLVSMRHLGQDEPISVKYSF